MSILCALPWSNRSAIGAPLMPDPCAIASFITPGAMMLMGLMPGGMPGAILGAGMTLGAMPRAMRLLGS